MTQQMRENPGYTFGFTRWALTAMATERTRGKRLEWGRVRRRMKGKSYSFTTLAGALHTEAVGCKLSLGRAVKTEIPVINQLTDLIQTGGHDTFFPCSDAGLVAVSDHYEVRGLSGGVLSSASPGHVSQMTLRYACDVS
jgi:hypothetical protein